MDSVCWKNSRTVRFYKNNHLNTLIQ
jgi:hypothetical protein